ncbi:MAG: hypothetical protein Q8Q60_00580 [Candidatus Chromulinivorax sp.]|nr:hypothetical protein [Candidatus Chromulinivorax sp.]
MKRSALLLLMMLFPSVVLASNVQKTSNFSDYLGSPSAALGLTVIYITKWAWPNQEAREAAPCLYHGGKVCYLLGAATSIISTAFAFQEVADATHVEIDHQYIDQAGQTMTLGLIFATLGETMTLKAAQIGRDKRKRAQTEEDLLTSLLPPTFGSESPRSRLNKFINNEEKV